MKFLFLIGQRLFNNIFLCNLNYSVSKKQPRKINKRKNIKLNIFYPRKLNILNDIIIIIGYFLKTLLWPRLNLVNYYKLEKPFRIQDSYARPQTINHTIKMIRVL